MTLKPPLIPLYRNLYRKHGDQCVRVKEVQTLMSVCAFAYVHVSIHL